MNDYFKKCFIIMIMVIMLAACGDKAEESKDIQNKDSTVIDSSSKKK